ncbi:MULTISPECIES: CGNR zinc finger domain-containing protein [unclassified Nocardiopsis]|uniref:CGNR zinc finger domain-containing protein n=1 Tax=Nocardiopsis TaxID=2013 RepID=UPI00387B6F32
MTDRPLLGEPLAMDLLNTRWISGGVALDLFDTPDGLARWLADNALAGRFPPDAAALPPLRHTRDVLAALVAEPGSPTAAAELNAVLAHGSVHRTLGATGPATATVVDDPAWGPAWAAAADYLDLLRAPDRIRRCGHPDCVLYFFDTSKNGTRRWCSMAGCGNRAKAARHQARARADRPA